jgi:hypothetical protein
VDGRVVALVQAVGIVATVGVAGLVAAARRVAHRAAFFDAIALLELLLAAHHAEVMFGVLKICHTRGLPSRES